MKPHGLLFKPEMILALLNTKPDTWPAEPINAARPFKFQTRRALKPQPTSKIEDADKHWALWGNSLSLADDEMETMEEWTCPHPVGQIVYAKETHWRWGRWSFRGGAMRFDPIVKQNDRSSQIRFTDEWDESLPPKLDQTTTGWHKRPSTFQPSWAARLWFVVKRVRVERVNAISEADCLAEGISWPDRDGRPYRPPIDTTGMSKLRLAAERYKELFDRINGKGAFDRGDWCWVYDLARVSRPTNRRFTEARGYTKCPNCKHKFGGGEQVYSCEVCGKDCCTVCTDTTAKHDVICDDCNEAASVNGYAPQKTMKIILNEKETDLPLDNGKLFGANVRMALGGERYQYLLYRVVLGSPDEQLMDGMEVREGDHIYSFPSAHGA